MKINFNLVVIALISVLILVSGATNPMACGKKKQ